MASDAKVGKLSLWGEKCNSLGESRGSQGVMDRLRLLLALGEHERVTAAPEAEEVA